MPDPLHAPNPTAHSQPADQQQPKRVRQRTLRACDACRKMKIKCMMHSDEAPCEACKLASRACKFEHVGVKREKPPSMREVEQLQRKIAQLEAVLARLRPQIDLSSLPRTNDQAKSMANALQEAHPTGLDNNNNNQIYLGPHHQAANLHQQVHNDTLHEYEELEHESHDDEDDDDDTEESDEEFQSMLKSMGECQLTSYQLFDQAAKDASSHPENASLQSSSSTSNALPPAKDQYQSDSLIEQYCETFLQVNSNWPAPDLADKLVSTYFEHVHPYPRVVHEMEFKKEYQAGLAERDAKFRKLCYAVFAAASPYCDDPRVLDPATPSSDQAPPHPRQSAGALFAHASLQEAPKRPPLGLFELQSYAILSYYMMAMSNPCHTFAFVVECLRKAVISEVHIEDSPHWNSSFLMNQLRKRAFFALIAVEKHTTSSLGYLSVPQPLFNIVSPPLSSDDATLSLLDREDKMQATPEARKQFRHQRCFRAHTPAEAAFTSMWCFRNKLESRSRNLILDQLSPNPPTSSSAASSSSSSTQQQHHHHSTPQSKACNSRHQFILNFEAVVADFLDNEMNPLGRWNPSLTSKEDLFATSYCACMVWSFQIRVHLEAISFYDQLVNPCFQAASSILDTLEDMKVLDHLQILRGTIPYFLAPVGLFFLWAISQQDNPVVTAHCKANAWLKLTKCVEILNILAPSSFVSEKLAQKFTTYIEDLKEEIHNPNHNTGGASTNASKKRPLSEIMAKKVEQPTISNLLFSQHPSPVNHNSHIDPSRVGPDASSSLSSASAASYLDLTLSDFMATPPSSQSPGCEYDANTSVPASAGNRNPPAPQPNAYSPVPYSHLQLQNLLLQYVNIPKQPPLDASYSNAPLPGEPRLPIHYPQRVNLEDPSSSASYDSSHLRSAFSTPTPAIPDPRRSHPQETHQTQPAYTGMNDIPAATGSGMNYMNTVAGSFGSQNSFDVSSLLSSGNGYAFEASSAAPGVDFSNPDTLLNPHTQRPAPAKHDATAPSFLPLQPHQQQQPLVPNQTYKLQVSRPHEADGYSTYAPQGVEMRGAGPSSSSSSGQRYAHPMAAAGPPGPGLLPQPQPHPSSNVHPSASTAPAHYYPRTFASGAGFSPASASSSVFSDSAPTPGNPAGPPAPLVHQTYPQAVPSAIPTNMYHHHHTDNKPHHLLASTHSNALPPPRHPNHASNPDPVFGFAFNSPPEPPASISQQDVNQIFSSICDTWLF